MSFIILVNILSSEEECQAHHKESHQKQLYKAGAEAKDNDIEKENRPKYNRKIDA